MSDLLDRLLAWDQGLFVHANRGLHDLADSYPEIGTALRAANEIGSGWVVLAGVVAIVALEPTVARGLRRAAELLIAALAAGLGAHVLKRSIDRSRPPEVLSAAFADGTVGGAFGQRFMDGSWPSGHTAAAFALVAVLWSWAATIPSVWRRWVVRAAMVVIASLTGVARIYAGVHFPLDVAGGAVFGLLCGALVIRLSRSVLGPWKPGCTTGPPRPRTTE